MNHHGDYLGKAEHRSDMVQFSTCAEEPASEMTASSQILTDVIHAVGK